MTDTEQKLYHLIVYIFIKNATCTCTYNMQREIKLLIIKISAKIYMHKNVHVLTVNQQLLLVRVHNTRATRCNFN